MALIFDSLIFLLIATFLFWCYEIYKKNKMLEKIPGPLCLPFIGFTKIPTDVYGMTEMFKNLFERYGKTVKFYIAEQMYVATCDANLIEAVLKSNIHIKKSRLYDLIRPWLKDGLIVSTGPKWRQRRKFLTPSFHFTMLKDFFPIFKEQADVLIKKLGEQADKGIVINVIDYVSKYALDVIGETSLGIKLNIQEGMNSEYIDAVDHMCEIVMKRNFSPWKRFDLPFRLFAQEYKEQQVVVSILNNLSRRVIQQKRAELRTQSNTYAEDFVTEEKKKVNLLDALLRHIELNDDDIQEEVNNFVFAGYDTTAAAISFALYELSKRPDVQEKMYNEINSYVDHNSEKLTSGNIQEMKYLDEVVKEVLRLRTPVPLIDRLLEENVKFGDILYPKGTIIIMELHRLHQQQDYYTDPDNFDPQRFNPDNAQIHPTSAYVPFSSGPRNCIGQKYGLLEMKTTLTKIIMEFKIHPVEGVETILGTAVILRSKQGYPVKLERREN